MLRVWFVDLVLISYQIQPLISCLCNTSTSLDSMGESKSRLPVPGFGITHSENSFSSVYSPERAWQLLGSWKFFLQDRWCYFNEHDFKHYFLNMTFKHYCSMSYNNLEGLRNLVNQHFPERKRVTSQNCIWVDGPSLGQNKPYAQCKSPSDYWEGFRFTLCTSLWETYLWLNQRPHEGSLPLSLYRAV